MMFVRIKYFNSNKLDQATEYVYPTLKNNFYSNH